MTWQRNLNNVDSHKSLISANVFFAVCAGCFPPWCWFKVVSGGPDKFDDLYTAQKFRDTFAVFEGSLGKTCSWRPLLRRCVSTCAQCLALELCTIFVAWNFRGAFLCKTFATFSSVRGRRCILHAMRKRFQAWLEMRWFRKSFLWFFVAGVVFGELGLCFEQIWTARGHRFVNICYFSACHDFAWQVQNSARFRMPQAHFSWEAQ